MPESGSDGCTGRAGPLPTESLPGNTASCHVAWIQLTDEIRELPICYQEALAGVFLGEKKKIVDLVTLWT